MLDLYCGGGGASFGYVNAGWDVVGVDLYPQPKYPYEFHQCDAIEFAKENYQYFDAIHASPPCQFHSLAAMQHRISGKSYADLIPETRSILISIGLPYIIENVPGAPLIDPYLFCGTMFNIRTYRHRLFETNFKLNIPPHGVHICPNAKMGRPVKDGEFIQYVGHFPGVKFVQEMTGLYWLGQKELAQSIPPQYTQLIGDQLLKILSEK